MPKVKGPQIYWQVGKGDKHELPPEAKVVVLTPASGKVTVHINKDGHVHVKESS